MKQIECGTQWYSAKDWLQEHEKSDHLSDWLRKKAPRRYVPLTFSIAAAVVVVDSCNSST